MPDSLASEDSFGLEDVRAGKCDRIECEKDHAEAKSNRAFNKFDP